MRNLTSPLVFSGLLAVTFSAAPVVAQDVHFPGAPPPAPTLQPEPVSSAMMQNHAVVPPAPEGMLWSDGNGLPASSRYPILPGQGGIYGGAPQVNYAAAPPPGTLGQTYLKPSALVPKNEHPRTGMIEIDARGFSNVEVLGLEDFDGFQSENKLWHFKSKKPLLPGAPHIYEIIANDGTPGPAEQSRTVRMIPGRIVKLTF